MSSLRSVRHWPNVVILLGSSFLIRIPPFYLERDPYLFCDEPIFAGEALKMFQNQSWITSEFKAGGLNIYLVLFSLYILRRIGIFPDHLDYIEVSRLLQPIILGGSTVVFIYFTANYIYKNRHSGLIAGFVFILAPGSYAYSRFAYPDHYVYFFSSGVLYFLVRYVDGKDVRKYLVFAGIFTGMATSVKYSGAFLVIPMFVAIICAVKASKSINYFGSLVSQVAIASISTGTTFILINFSALIRPNEFIGGLLFNSNNYAKGSFFSNEYSSSVSALSGYSYYFVVAFVIFFGVATFPLYVLGMYRLFTDKEKYFAILFSFPISLIAYLGTLGFSLNRNMSIVIPFVVIPITGSLTYLFTSRRNPSNRLLRLGQVAVVTLVVITCIQTIYNVTKDMKKDSRLVARDWIASNINPGARVGVNEACSGRSPAEGVVSEVLSDPSMNLTLDYYVFNSYWESPLQSFYRNRIPFWLELEQKQIHFYHFGDRRLFTGFTSKNSIHDFVPDSYKIIKIIHSTGPEIVILERKDIRILR